MVQAKDDPDPADRGPGASWELPECPAQASAIAARAADALVLLPAREAGVELDPGCPLAPERDMYFALHAAKSHAVGLQWHCALCGKSFVREHYLDKHIRLRHPHVIPSRADECLADYCGFLAPASRWCHTPVLHAEACSDASLRRRQEQCRRTLRRCVVGASGAALLQDLEKDVCEALACGSGGRWRGAHIHESHGSAMWYMSRTASRVGYVLVEAVSVLLLVGIAWYYARVARENIVQPFRARQAQRVRTPQLLTRRRRGHKGMEL